MRISKDPEIRKREIVDAAMQVFAEKSYESVSMADIAKAVQVVPGLCYRYFRSKQELYEYTLALYAGECSAPLAGIMDRAGSAEACMEELTQYLERGMDREPYTAFFHKEGNEHFHHELDLRMAELLVPHLTAMLERLGICPGDSPRQREARAAFILHGQMPVINDMSMSAAERIGLVTPLILRLLEP